MRTSRTASLALVTVTAAALVGCRRKVASKPAGPCPAPEALAAMVAEKGRELRAACAAYPGVPYYMAGVFTFDARTRKDPRLMLLAGGQGSRTLAFDVVPAPVAELSELIGAADDVRVRIKITQSSLVRLSVWTRTHARPDVLAEEIVLLLQLVAHAPPRLLWAGPGDRTTKAADGCMTDQFVEFQSVFGQQISMVTTARSRPGCPPAGPGVQEPLAVRPRPLAAGREVGP